MTADILHSNLIEKGTSTTFQANDMDPNRQKSKAILDAYVLAKEIKLVAGCTDSRHFDPVSLYERAVAMPEPPDQKERRCSARALIEAGHAILDHARPDLAGVIFEKAYLLLSHTKSGMLRSRAMAGVILCWERMGKPAYGSGFIERALTTIEKQRGHKAREKQQKQLSKAIDKAKQIQLPRLGYGNDSCKIQPFATLQPSESVTGLAISTA